MTKPEKAQRLQKIFPNPTPAERQLIEEIMGLTDSQCELLAKILDQDKRASKLGLKLDIDLGLKSFFIADAATRCVIVPPSMTLEAVTAWLDNYENNKSIA